MLRFPISKTQMVRWCGDAVMRQHEHSENCIKTVYTTFVVYRVKTGPPDGKTPGSSKRRVYYY